MYTEIGVPVQYFDTINCDNKHIYHPGIISSVDGGVVDIRVFPADGTQSFVAKDVRHIDDAVRNEPFWLHIKSDIVEVKKPEKTADPKPDHPFKKIYLIALIIAAILFLYHAYMYLINGKDCSNADVLSMVFVCALLIHEKYYIRKN